MSYAAVVIGTSRVNLYTEKPRANRRDLGQIDLDLYCLQCRPSYILSISLGSQTSAKTLYNYVARLSCLNI